MYDLICLIKKIIAETVLVFIDREKRRLLLWYSNYLFSELSWGFERSPDTI